jgi:hypothetical protein
MFEVQKEVFSILRQVRFLARYYLEVATE